MLQRAAAADLKVRTAWGHPGGGGRQDLLEPGLIVLPVAAHAAEANGFPRQRPGDEGSLAVVDDALTLLAQGRDHAGFAGAIDDGGTPAQAAASQALRNSA